MEILAACPAYAATGGPEALHQFVSELNKLDGIDAKIWYWDYAGGDPEPDEYKAYKCEYVTQLPEDYTGALVLPEIYASRIEDFPCGVKAIYWLGLDAYPMWTPPGMRGAFLDDEEILHIVQSEYARDFLETMGVKRIVKCGDLLNEDFFAECEEKERDDAVLYNPAKATAFMHRLMGECHGITFKPIKGMTRQEVIDAMHSAKLYVDFGEFPGRERMPREAVASGCCIITSRIGSAAQYGDFPHTYKFESKDGHIWAINYMIRHVLEHYEECRKDFDHFRKELSNERDLYREQIEDVARALDEVQHNHTGI